MTKKTKQIIIGIVVGIILIGFIYFLVNKGNNSNDNRLLTMTNEEITTEIANSTENTKERYSKAEFPEFTSVQLVDDIVNNIQEEYPNGKIEFLTIISNNKELTSSKQGDIEFQIGLEAIVVKNQDGSKNIVNTSSPYILPNKYITYYETSGFTPIKLNKNNYELRSIGTIFAKKTVGKGKDFVNTDDKNLYSTNIESFKIKVNLD